MWFVMIFSIMYHWVAIVLSLILLVFFTAFFLLFAWCSWGVSRRDWKGGLWSDEIWVDRIINGWGVVVVVSAWIDVFTTGFR